MRWWGQTCTVNCPPYRFFCWPAVKINPLRSKNWKSRIINSKLPGSDGILKASTYRHFQRKWAPTLVKCFVFFLSDGRTREKVNKLISSAAASQWAESLWFNPRRNATDLAFVSITASGQSRRGALYPAPAERARLKWDYNCNLYGNRALATSGVKNYNEPSVSRE